MKRIFTLLTTGLALASSSIFAQAKKQPNVIFILADDLGWTDTSLYGHTEFYKTPHVERLAKRGMTFDHAYSASPLCSPTRSAILTGLSPARTGLTSPNCHLPAVILEATAGTKGNPGNKAISPNGVTRLDTSYPTIAKTLKAEGYATGHFGKWHLGPEPYSPLQHGFDVDIPHHPGPGPAGSYVAPWKFRDFDHDPEHPNQHIEDRMAEEAVEWMEKQKDKPFFLNYWMFSVHGPFDAKEPLIKKYRGKVNPKDEQRCPTYAAMIESMDDAIGTLLDAIDRLGLTDDTIIIFTSDNGGNMYNVVEGESPTSNRPLRGGKASMFEGGVRVPAIVIMPGVVKPDTRSKAVIQSEDYYPTLLTALDLKPAKGQQFDGTDFMPALKGRPFSRNSVFQYFPHNPPVPDWVPPSISVHENDWKLIRLFHQGENGKHRYLLYDLSKDIGEKKNLASTHPEKVTRLDAQIEAFIKDTKTVIPVPNPTFDPSKYRPENEGKGRVRTSSKAKPSAPKPPTDLKGWKRRNVNTAKQKGTLTLSAAGPTPFLGTAIAGEGPLTFSMRVRPKTTGTGRIELLHKGKVTKTTPFQVTKSGWQEINVEIANDQPFSIIRYHLPSKSLPMDIDWLKARGTKAPRTWDF